MTPEPSAFNPRIAARQRTSVIVAVALFLATFVGVVVLLTLLVDVAIKAAPWLDAEFLTNYPSRRPERAGIHSAIFGSLWLMGLTALVAVPVGVAAALYLEEYAPRGWFYRVIQTNIANLAGVPSVIYGMLGLLLFVRTLGAGRSLLAGALTTSLLVLPVIILSTQEALRALPQGLRESAYALGATRSQVIAGHLIPSAAPGILTGIILALSRGVGETAPVILAGALTFVTFVPTGVLDPYAVLPLQIFNWTSRPQPEFQGLA
ncbi:MAG TPA: phosphate ABC transporter permease PstA, partial [Rhodothermales bacterium]|nr:phosphate ABC transporter permease PstA [Rhodothermales bacterium]